MPSLIWSIFDGATTRRLRCRNSCTRSECSIPLTPVRGASLDRLGWSSQACRPRLYPRCGCVRACGAPIRYLVPAPGLSEGCKVSRFAGTRSVSSGAEARILCPDCQRLGLRLSAPTHSSRAGIVLSPHRALMRRHRRGLPGGARAGAPGRHARSGRAGWKTRARRRSSSGGSTSSGRSIRS